MPQYSLVALHSLNDSDPARIRGSKMIQVHKLAGQQTQTNCRLYLTHFDTCHPWLLGILFLFLFFFPVKTLLQQQPRCVIVSLRYVFHVLQTSQSAMRRVCIPSVDHVLSVIQDLRLSSESSVSHSRFSGCGNMTGRQRIGRKTSNTSVCCEWSRCLLLPYPFTFNSI